MTTEPDLESLARALRMGSIQAAHYPHGLPTTTWGLDINGRPTSVVEEVAEFG